MACVLDPDIAVLFFFTRQQKLICRLFAQPKQKNGTDQNRCQFPKTTPVFPFDFIAPMQFSYKR